MAARYRGYSVCAQIAQCIMLKMSPFDDVIMAHRHIRATFYKYGLTLILSWMSKLTPTEIELSIYSQTSAAAPLSLDK